MSSRESTVEEYTEQVNKEFDLYQSILLEEHEKFYQGIKLATEGGIPRNTALLNSGWSQQQIDDMIADEKEAAVKVQRAETTNTRRDARNAALSDLQNDIEEGV